jgi:ribosomal protein L20A (L18A)
MPPKSKAQQKFMGMVHALQTGAIAPSSVSGRVMKAAGSMTQKAAKEFASTKTKGLPEHVMTAIKKRIKRR